MSGPGVLPVNPTPRWRRFLGACRASPGKTICAGLGLLLLLAACLADSLLAGPMRSWAERMMNANLKGYQVHIGKVRPHLWRLGFDLENLELVQNTHPEPPVANAGALEFSVVLGELLRFKLAGDLKIQHPALHINLTQIREEAKSDVRLRDRGWQRAVESIFPVKLDRVKVQDGSLLYLSSSPSSKPLEFTRIFMVATNIRNIAAVTGTYPSPVSLEGILFATGKVRFKGAADFLCEPYFATRGEIRLERVPLDRFTPLAQEYQLKTTGGYLSVNGIMEFTPKVRKAHLTRVLLEDLRVDYQTSTATRAMEAKHAEQAVKLADSIRNTPKLVLQVDTLRLTNSQIGFVNEAAKPPYRLFISGVSLNLDNLSNQANLGQSKFHARGLFMGSGTTVVSGEFQPTTRPLDFAVQLQMDDARLADINDFLLGQAGVDVADGQFSAYTEITVKNGQLQGYLKPLVKNLKIYDRRKDQAKPFRKRMELHLLQLLAEVGKNRSTQEVATVMTFSGSTSHPKAGKWQAIRRLTGNGLFRGIAPGFLEKPQALAPVRLNLAKEGH
jgi:hypothetical protein